MDFYNQVLILQLYLVFSLYDLPAYISMMDNTHTSLGLNVILIDYRPTEPRRLPKASYAVKVAT